MKKINLLLVGSALIALAGCSSDVNVSVRFSQVQDIESGDPVLFNGAQIGEVSEVESHEQGNLIELELDPEKISGINDLSAAMVVNQPNRHLEIYSGPQGNELASGSQIHGLNNGVELATWTASNALGSLQGLATSAASAFNQFLNENNWEEVAKQLNDSLSGLEEQSADALNDLGSELEAFINDMKEQSSKSVELADELSKQLKRELQKFQSQGRDDIAETLQNMLDAFNSAMDHSAVPESENKGEPL